MCDIEIFDIVVKILVLNCEIVKEIDSFILISVLLKRDLKLINVVCKDKLLFLVIININKIFWFEVIVDDNVEGKVSIELYCKDKDVDNGLDLLVDFICYEISVSDLICGESDDLVVLNGFYLDLKLLILCKLVEMDVKFCNGVNWLVIFDIKSVE